MSSKQVATYFRLLKTTNYVHLCRKNLFQMSREETIRGKIGLNIKIREQLLLKIDTGKQP